MFGSWVTIELLVSPDLVMHMISCMQADTSIVYNQTQVDAFLASKADGSLLTNVANMKADASSV